VVVNYLQFPIQVCFSCSASPSPTLLPSQTRVVFIEDYSARGIVPSIAMSMREGRNQGVF